MALDADWFAARGIPRAEDCMLLRLPDVRQKEVHECGRAAVQCVLQFHGVVMPVKLSTPIDGTDPREVESFFHGRRMPVVAGSMEVQDLRYYCDSRRPPIALVHWPDDADSHYVVVRGVGRGAVYIHDVASGPARIPLADWSAAWQASGRFEAFKRWAIVAWPP